MRNERKEISSKFFLNPNQETGRILQTFLLHYQTTHFYEKNNHILCLFSALGEEEKQVAIKSLQKQGE